MKLQIKKILMALSLLWVAGCATNEMRNLNPEDKAYLEKVKNAPLDFNMSKEESADAWGRAQSFIGQYSSMKLQITTDYVIQTYNPGQYELGFGYYVTKTPIGKEVKISVKCITSSFLGGKNAESNAHILANYIKTGELPTNLQLINH